MKLNKTKPKLKKGGMFLKKLWCCVGERQSEWWSANARNVSFKESSQWPINVINSIGSIYVDDTKLPCKPSLSVYKILNVALVFSPR